MVKALEEQRAQRADGWAELEATLESKSATLELIDGGTSPDVIYLLEDADHLIVVDAVRAGGEPGAIYRFSPEDIGANHHIAISLHELNLLDSLAMMERLGNRPKEIVIVGVEPQEIGWGLELTPTIRDRVDQVARVAIREVALAVDRSEVKLPGTTKEAMDQ